MRKKNKKRFFEGKLFLKKSRKSLFQGKKKFGCLGLSQIFLPMKFLKSLEDSGKIPQNPPI